MTDWTLYIQSKSALQHSSTKKDTKKKHTKSLWKSHKNMDDRWVTVVKDKRRLINDFLLCKILFLIF